MMKPTKDLSEVLVCPYCNGNFVWDAEALRCAACNKVFTANRQGYYDFNVDQRTAEIHSTSVEYAEVQKKHGLRVFNEYLKDFLFCEQIERVLDAGCGMGAGISELVKMDYEAYGIDLPGLSPFWVRAGNNPHNFFAADAGKLPFRNDYFDVVYSLGVIEHIGTVDGQAIPLDNYWEIRQEYANSLIRVTKPSGRIIVSCPNKSFPVDLQHGAPAFVGDSRIRKYIWDKTQLNIHPVWGRYHLLSYSETKRLFCDRGGCKSIEPLPLRNYFGFNIAGNIGFLNFSKKLMEVYVNNLPRLFRSTFLNPYMLVVIRK